MKKRFPVETILLRWLPGIFHPAYQLGKIFVNRCVEENLDQASAALTFGMLLALVPIVTISLNVLALLPESAIWMQAFEAFLEKNLLPEKAAVVVTDYARQFSANAAKLTRIGFVMLAVTSFMMLHTMEVVLNRFWRVKKMRHWTRRVFLYVFLIGVGPWIAGGLLLGVSDAIKALLGWTRQLDWLVSLLYPVAEFLLLALSLTYLYIALPSTRVRVRPALIGGFAAATGIELSRHLFGLYLVHFPSYTLLYGVFATLPIFLLWQYVTWAIVLAGSLLSSILQIEQFQQENVLSS